MEAGETPWKAAVREVREELGLELTGLPVLLCVQARMARAAGMDV